MKGHNISHRHSWVVGIIGLIVGLVFLFYVPTLRAVSGIIFLVVSVHIVGAVILSGSIYSLASGWIARAWAHLKPGNQEPAAPRIDFGYSPVWMNGFWIAALAVGTAAVVIQVAAPGWWPASFLLLLLAANLFAGNLFLHASKKVDYIVLPMVELFSGERDKVLDAGCGSGRATIALAWAHRYARIVSLDRFDAAYIEEGGRALLEHNLRIAGIADRVTIEKGDITALPFSEGSFDSAVSAHAIDHLGTNKERGLAEILRVLKPGGRFLLVVSVPGWVMFAIINVFSFFMTSRQSWREMARRAGFEIKQEGMLNGTRFLLLEKPLGRTKG